MSLTIDSYSDHPPTIGEVRSDKTGQASDWTLRDMLISTLRDIDNGLFPDTRGILLLGKLDPDKGCLMQIRRAATGNSWKSAGMLHEALQVILRPD